MARRKTETAEPKHEEPKEPHISPTLDSIDPSRLPLPEVACATCPRSIWYSTAEELSCYCRIMYVITWTTRQPGRITLCDGQKQET